MGTSSVERALVGATQNVSVLRLVNDGWPEPNTWQGFCSTA